MVISYPNFDRPFYLATDASDRALGAVLFQLDENQKPLYISFGSRVLRKAERNYGAFKRELLAVVWSLEYYRYYLLGRHFTLYTDHKPLTYIFSQKQNHPVVNNWLETILFYDFTFVHLPGVRNVLPDQLSRLYHDEVPDRIDEDIQISEILVEQLNNNEDPLLDHERESPRYINSIQ